jgi:hypothetical protein
MEEKKYANLHGYSDIVPFEVIKETKKTITIRQMQFEKAFKPEYVEGGFSAICTNNNKQEWIIAQNENNPLIKAYMRKDGFYWSKYGKHIISDVPVKFYDYNF